MSRKLRAFAGAAAALVAVTFMLGFGLHARASAPAGKTVSFPAPARGAGSLLAPSPGIQVAQGDRLSQCLVCCDQKLNDCLKTDGGSGKCATLHQNCVNHCNSHGETPSPWACW